PDAVIHAARAPHPRVNAAVHTPAPARVAEHVVLLGPLGLEERFGLSVSDLLLPVSLQRVAPMMPDHRRGAEADRPTTILNLPTDIDVVAGHAEPWVEAADLSERGGAKGHVASG